MTIKHQEKMIMQEAGASGAAKTPFITENAAVCGDFADECRGPVRIYPRI